MAGDEKLWARLDELELEEEEEFLRKGDHEASLEGDVVAKGTTNVEHKEGTLVRGDRPSASRSEVRGGKTREEKPVSAAPPLRIAVTHTKMDATDHSSHEVCL